MNCDALDSAYAECWSGLPDHFARERA